MKYRTKLLLLVCCAALSCQNQPQRTTAKTNTRHAIGKDLPEMHADTLQFIHFDGNLDYWYAFFLTSQKDTLRLVTDRLLEKDLLNRLLIVRWKPDSLWEAGDDERKYIDKRIISYKEIRGNPFIPAISEEQVLDDIRNLVEVKENAERVWIAKKPNFEYPYYEIETATEGEGTVSRLYSFRAYTYPRYEIKIFNRSNDSELALADWRKINN
ncbi:hypothetical protein [Pedobacter insulae]|uniref:Uncharacterized protein n=1 Tax=Pedobacter insulae TaxID=414048 RepID=A0A1I2WS69_9SPHI|nr:hypothetical protein [Pedobacter insulae]SFH04135.1 hypothetical protein SAMN04489864_104250 [Pedobacter insulae]